MPEGFVQIEPGSNQGWFRSRLVQIKAGFRRSPAVGRSSHAVRKQFSADGPKIPPDVALEDRGPKKAF
jgi:hypothetical protein